MLNISKYSPFLNIQNINLAKTILTLLEYYWTFCMFWLFRLQRQGLPERSEQWEHNDSKYNSYPCQTFQHFLHVLNIQNIMMAKNSESIKMAMTILTLAAHFLLAPSSSSRRERWGPDCSKRPEKSSAVTEEEMGRKARRPLEGWADRSGTEEGNPEIRRGRSAAPVVWKEKDHWG